jgi:hypothetical protein
MAEEFRGRDVGIVSKHGAGNLFMWDIDQPGVLERMEQEAGQRLPDTYITQTRPVTAPHKRHVYLRQTAHSVLHLTKEANGLGDYDVKGIGGGGVRGGRGLCT